MSSEGEEAELRSGEGKVGDLYYSQSPLGQGSSSWSQADLDQAASIGIPTSAATYYTNDAPSSPTKYQENGHDTFSDFVTLVCQEAGQPAPGHAPRSPTKLVSYYSSMFPPAPAPPMARPVPVKLPEAVASPPPMQVSPPPSDSPHPALREVRLSPSPLDLQSGGRTVFYTYSGGGTIALSDSLSPTNLSVVQPPRSLPAASTAPSRAAPAIRWTTSTGSFISDMESSSIAYDLMTPMISSSSLQLQDDSRYFSAQLEPMDATVGGVGLASPTQQPEK